MSLVMENVSFSQELNDTFQQQDVNFDMRKRAIKNSRRSKSKALIRADQRIRRARRNVRKAMTAKRKLARSIR